MKLKAVMIIVLLLSTAAFAEGPRVSFSLRGGYYLPSSSTFNKDYLPVVNANLNDLYSYLKELGLTGTLTELPELRGGVIFGGEFEIYASRQFTIVLGTEFMMKSLRTNLDLSGKVEEVSFGATQDSRVRMSVLPILGTIRINLPIEIVRVYLGGGAGYYLGRAVTEENWTWTEESVSVNEGSRKITSTGRNLIPHANVGVDVTLTKHLYFTADLRYAFGKLGSFKIKSDTLDSSSVGQNLTFVDSNGAEQDFKWELSGPSVSASLKLKF